MCLWVNVLQLMYLFSMNEDGFPFRNRYKSIRVSKVNDMLDYPFCIIGILDPVFGNSNFFFLLFQVSFFCLDTVNQKCNKGIFTWVVLEAMHHGLSAKCPFQFKCPFEFLPFLLHKLYFFRVLLSVIILRPFLLTSINFSLHLGPLLFHILQVIFGRAPTPVQKSVLHEFVHCLFIPQKH